MTNISSTKDTFQNQSTSLTLTPSLTAVDQHNNPVGLSDYRGHYLVLYFYPKDNTPGCTTEAKDFEGALPEFNKLNAKIVGVSKDSVKSHQTFCSSQDLTFTLLSDAEGDLCKSYGCWVEKKNYGKTYMGIQRSTFIIDPQGHLIKEWRNVRVPGHVERVLAFLHDATRSGGECGT